MKQSKPLLLITGFLGAGKTTLLRRLLTDLQQNNYKADVILNDFANAEIDSATIDPSFTTSLVPLAAGCACCESLDELVLLCRSASQGKGDLVLIELNGTADPLPLLETFTLLEDRLKFFPRLQVCVIDARHWEERSEYNDLERQQLETASFWYLSHNKEVSENRLSRIRKKIRMAAPHSSEIQAEELIQILSIEAERSKSSPPEVTSYSISQPNRKIDEHKLEKNQLSHINDDAHQLSHRFSGYTVPLPHTVSSSAMKQLMDMIPDWVLRAKALVTMPENPSSRWLFEKVGKETIPNPMAIHDLPNTPSSLMCIGPKLNPEKLDKIVESIFNTN